MHRLAIDPRALAVVRIGFGLFVAGSCLTRLPDAASFYSDHGPLPREVRIGELASTLNPTALRPWSLLFLDGSGAWSTVVVLAGAVLGVLVALGFATRVATFFCWVVVASLRVRTPYAGDGGDSLIVVVLFWAIFLPWGTVWSIDALRRKKVTIGPKFMQPQHSPVFSGASAAILLQLCLVYWVAAVSKHDPSWRTEGTALSHALGVEVLTRPLADHILKFDSLLRLLTHATLLIEEIGPLAAILIPWSSRWRVAGPLSVIALHLGIASFFALGMFPWVSIIAWLLFFPSWFWDRASHLIGHAKSCAFEKGASCDQASPDPIIPAPWSRKIFYDLTPLVLFGIACWWTIGFLGISPAWLPQPTWLTSTINVLRLRQDWTYFAPSVNTREGWYVVTATTASGIRHALDWSGSPVDSNYADAKPPLRKLYPNKRWRGLAPRPFHSRNPAHIESYARWLRSKWEAAHPGESLKTLTIDFMLVDNRYPEDGFSPVNVYPVEKIGPDGRAIFPGDTRRNQRDEERAKAREDRARDEGAERQEDADDRRSKEFETPGDQIGRAHV